MRVYTGGLSQRRFVPGEEAWQFTDEGTDVITSKRVVFKGQTLSAPEQNGRYLPNCDGATAW